MCNQHQPFLRCFRSEDWHQLGQDQDVQDIQEAAGQYVGEAAAISEEQYELSDEGELLFLV